MEARLGPHEANILLRDAARTPREILMQEVEQHHQQHARRQTACLVHALGFRVLVMGYRVGVWGLVVGGCRF